MIIRNIDHSDIAKVRAIHEEFFSHEFSFPDFINGFKLSFVVEDNDNIVLAGGVRTLLEVVAVTNKDLHVKNRVAALYKLLDASRFTAERLGHDSLHAFVQDESWLRILKKKGFRPTRGTAVVLEV